MHKQLDSERDRTRAAERERDRLAALLAAGGEIATPPAAKKRPALGSARLDLASRANLPLANRWVRNACQTLGQAAFTELVVEQIVLCVVGRRGVRLDKRWFSCDILSRIFACADLQSHLAKLVVKRSRELTSARQWVMVLHRTGVSTRQLKLLRRTQGGPIDSVPGTETITAEACVVAKEIQVYYGCGALGADVTPDSGDESDEQRTRGAASVEAGAAAQRGDPLPFDRLPVVAPTLLTVRAAKTLKLDRADSAQEHVHSVVASCADGVRVETVYAEHVLERRQQTLDYGADVVKVVGMLVLPVLHGSTQLSTPQITIAMHADACANKGVGSVLKHVNASIVRVVHSGSGALRPGGNIDGFGSNSSMIGPRTLTLTDGTHVHHQGAMSAHCAFMLGTHVGSDKPENVRAMYADDPIAASHARDPARPRACARSLGCASDAAPCARPPAPTLPPPARRRARR